MSLEKLVNEAIQGVSPPNKHLEEFLGYLAYIKSFRTLILSVPRRSGKTYLLKQLASKKSALLIKKYGPPESRLEAGYKFRGIRSPLNLKYNYILLDEYVDIPDTLWELISELKLCDMVSDDLIVLALGTRY
jgi:predicted AAA+ superfamily ATPase